ncbi:MAG: hypothetical protein N2Z84_04085 [Atribacterota bacterium]|nr:hypothetical protein [Atribacterota bacterium]
MFELTEKTYTTLKKDLMFWIEAVDAWRPYGILLKKEELLELRDLAITLSQKLDAEIKKQEQPCGF